MCSLSTQSKACQLFRRELEEIPRLSSRIIAAALPQQQQEVVVGGGLLTEAHIRGLVVGAPVRVAIPAKKRDALVVGNPFIQAAVTTAMAAAAAAAAAKSNARELGEPTDTHGPSTGKSVHGVQDRNAFLPSHRVGVVVALLPKPGAEAASPSPGDWLLAVNLGEATEVFPLRSVSEDAFTEQEHQVYVQSTLGGAAGKGHSLLSGEQVEAMKRRIVELRMALSVVLGVVPAPAAAAASASRPSQGKAEKHHQSPPSDSGGTTEMEEQRRALLDALIAGRRDGNGSSFSPAPATRKRSRTTDAGEEEGEGEEEEEGDDGEHLKGPSSAHSRDSLLARLSETVHRQSAQLQMLRQLVERKEADIAAAIQQQQQSERQHAAEMSQLRVKAEEEARARERSLRETAEQLRERDGKLHVAGEKLRGVAEMAAKYRRMYHELVTTALGCTMDDVKSKGPEEILSLVKAKMSP